MAGEAEVADVRVLALGIGADEDVAGLHVAMDEPGRVRGVERRRPPARRGSIAALRLEAAVPPEELAQIGALDVLHREVEPAVLLAGAQRPDDVRVVEARRQPGLAQEPLPEPLVTREAVVENLQRDDATVCLVAGTVDPGHRTVTNERLDTKSRDGRARRQLRSHCRHPSMAAPSPMIKFWRGCGAGYWKNMKTAVCGGVPSFVCSRNWRQVPAQLPLVCHPNV